MSAIVLDECLYYLKEAQDYLSLYSEIDPYEEIFEAYKPETQIKVQQSKKAKSGVMGSLEKAGRAIKEMIQRIIDSIKDFFDKRKMDKTERQAFEEYKAACAKDPSLKNKKILVRDFREVTKKYNSILKEAEEADRKIAMDKAVNTDALFKKMTDFCKETANGVKVSVGCEAALNMASSSRELAQEMYKSLKQDQELEDKLIKAIGKSETARFEKQMKSLGKRFSLHRMVMKVKGTYSKSVEEGIDNTFSTIEDMIKGTTKIVGTTKDLDNDIAVKGNPLQKAAHYTSYVGKNLGTLASGGKDIAKGEGIVRRAYGNDAIKTATKEIMAMSSDSTKDAKRMYKQNKKAERRQAFHNVKEKIFPSKTHDQSAMDAILGANDPKSALGKITQPYRDIKKMKSKMDYKHI